MILRTRLGAGLAVAGLVLCGVGALAAPAYADYAPGPNDIVGVGGDTPQFDLAFGADGDVTADPGYNTAGNAYKLISFNATADGNARQAYQNGSTETSTLPLYPTVTLRAGTSPVQRVASSGSAISALLADTASPEVINYVFSASEPTAAQQTTAGNNGWGYLHVVRLGTDSVEAVRASSGSHVPSSLTIAQLLRVYTGADTNWSQLGGTSGTIVPLLPPSTSSITKTFLADLKVANGGTAPTLASTVQTVEQNDPSAITSNGDPADAVVPFSSARLNLYQDGYFLNQGVASPTRTALTPGVSGVTGGSSYSSPVNHYVIFRQRDANSTTPWQPGSRFNWVQTLFSAPPGDPTPFFDSTAGLADIAAAGTTASYADLGDASSG